jgi:hypothetical protein
VALLGMKPKLRDILADAIGREADMQLVGFATGSDSRSPEPAPDVMICESADPLEAIAPTELLRAAPQARVLVIAGTGDRAAVYELQPIRRELSNLSINAVIEAVRHGLAVGRTP